MELALLAVLLVVVLYVSLIFVLPRLISIICTFFLKCTLVARRINLQGRALEDITISKQLANGFHVQINLKRLRFGSNWMSNAHAYLDISAQEVEVKIHGKGALSSLVPKGSGKSEDHGSSGRISFGRWFDRAVSLSNLISCSITNLSVEIEFEDPKKGRLGSQMRVSHFLMATKRIHHENEKLCCQISQIRQELSLDECSLGVAEIPSLEILIDFDLIAVDLAQGEIRIPSQWHGLNHWHPALKLPALPKQEFVLNIHKLKVKWPQKSEFNLQCHSLKCGSTRTVEFALLLLEVNLERAHGEFNATTAQLSVNLPAVLGSLVDLPEPLKNQSLMLNFHYLRLDTKDIGSDFSVHAMVFNDPQRECPIVKVESISSSCDGDRTLINVHAHKLEVFLEYTVLMILLDLTSLTLAKLPRRPISVAKATDGFKPVERHISVGCDQISAALSVDRRGNVILSSVGQDFGVSFKCKSSWAATIRKISVIDHTRVKRPLVFLDCEQPLSLIREAQTMEVTTKSNIRVSWQGYAHLALFRMSSLVKEKLQGLQSFWKVNHGSSSQSGSKVKFSADCPSISVHLHLPETLMTLVFKNPTLTRTIEDALHIGVTKGRIGFDKYPDIISWIDLNVCSAENQSNHRVEMTKKLTPSNRLIEISVVTFEISFPYEYNVHKAYSTDLMGTFKWLKRLHGVDQSNFDRIHPDVLLYAKTISIQLADDPFEVALRDNYELLEDEFFESHKRAACLEAKIDELRRTHILLPSNKIEELFASLLKKNAEIYIQRSKNLRQKTPRRTRLMQACYNSLKLHILSDQSLAGWENTTKFMKGVEPDLVWPEDISFSTILAKWVRFECKNAFLKLRDFPQPFIEMRHLLFWGKVVFADESPGPRAKRTQTLKMGHPDFPDESIERSLQSPKLYMDIAMDMGYYSFSHGPCWEPVIGQVFAAMNYITGLKKNDPSPPLTWWDKMRYFIHGRLLWSVQSYKGYLHTSLDPYNTTEEIELSLTNANFQFINNSVVKCVAQSLDLYARTASKYDDCRLFHTPNFSLSIYFVWLCQGQAKDHFAVSLCSRQKLPEFSAQQGHDSFRAFRSHNMNVRIDLETTKTFSHEKPKIHLYSSTIRWMESLKWLFSGMARPVRRGALFGTPPVRKQSFFRHFKGVDISCSFNCLEFDYWTSASMTRGILVVISKGLFFSGKYRLHLAKVNDGLIRRPRTAWITEYTNCEFSSTDVWFQCIWSNSTANNENNNNNNNNANNSNADTDTASEGGQSSSTVSEEGGGVTGSRQLEKNFFFFVEKVQYDRDISKFKQQQSQQPSQPQPQPSDTTSSSPSCPLHCLIVNGARGAWTTSNRDMAFALYQSWRRAHILRNQLSSDGLKPLQQKDIKMSTQGVEEPSTTPGSQESSSPPLGLFTQKGDDELCLSKLNWNDKAYVEELLENPSCTTVYSDDQYVNAKEKELDAKTAAVGKNDVQQREWVIKFINCQMLLKGTETKGYLILSATKAEALRTIHTPVWKDETLLSKSSWSGALECMQYFATVSPNPETVLIDEILWVPPEMIESRETTNATLAPQEDLIDASNRSVGGVISGQSGPHQLQRIVSQCKCEFFYVAYGDDNVEVDRDVIPRRPDESPWTDRDDYVNCFALIHHDLNVSTNSLQYSMILDVVNNLLLFIDPTFRSRTENFLRLKYQLMLSGVMDQRKPIAQLQSQIRQLICQLRAREKDVYYFHSGRNHERALDDLEAEIQRLKESVAHMSEELDLRLRCLNDFQLSQNQKRHLLHNDRKGELRQKSEIFFSRAQWRLTETDGQLGIADADIVNFSYSRAIMRDDSTEHLLEIGYITVKNLLKEQLYTEVISPSDLTNVPVDRQRTLRMFCREKPPVGGISVKDHFEINLVPLSIGITQSFYKKIVMFCFPERLSADAKVDQMAHKDKKKATLSSKKSSNFYVDVPLCKDDVELMKERAQQNKLFVYIKIPEVPITVSFKSEKEKNKILDVSGFLLQVPTIEYHNVTWTWLDFLMAVKSRTKDSLVSQAIKQKLSMRSTHAKSEAAKNKRQNALNLQDDTEKAKLLFGDINFPQGGARKKK